MKELVRKGNNFLTRVFLNTFLSPKNRIVIVKQCRLWYFCICKERMMLKKSSSNKIQFFLMCFRSFGSFNNKKEIQYFVIRRKKISFVAISRLKYQTTKVQTTTPPQSIKFTRFFSSENFHIKAKFGDNLSIIIKSY